MALILACAALLAPAAGRAQGGDPAPMLARMAKVNATLHSYTASTHVDIALHSFPFVSPSLDGNYYYKQPDKSAIVFDTVPALAKQFQKIYPRLDPVTSWNELYTITQLGDDGTTTTLRLVPRKQGRVAHLDVKVDDASATVRQYVWSYVDGGSIGFDQEFTQIDGDYLVKSQVGKVDLPSYKADVKSTFSDFKVNVVIADKVFAS